VKISGRGEIVEIVESPETTTKFGGANFTANAAHPESVPSTKNIRRCERRVTPKKRGGHPSPRSWSRKIRENGKTKGGQEGEKGE